MVIYVTEPVVLVGQDIINDVGNIFIANAAFFDRLWYQSLVELANASMLQDATIHIYSNEISDIRRLAQLEWVPQSSINTYLWANAEMESEWEINDGIFDFVVYQPQIQPAPSKFLVVHSPTICRALFASSGEVYGSGSEQQYMGINITNRLTIKTLALRLGMLLSTYC